MTAPRWNERDAAQALLAAFRNDYETPGKPCDGGCHCEECIAETKGRCCTLGKLLVQAEAIVKASRLSRSPAARAGSSRKRGRRG